MQLPEFIDVVVVGGGQAGLSTSWHLKARGIEHVVLESQRFANEWRVNRWDAFTLVTPNWQCQLPGWPYTGPDPDGFMTQKEVVEYFEGFVASFDPPLVEGVSVTGVSRTPDGDYLVQTTAGDIRCSHVVVGTGGYQIPIMPPFAPALPAGIVQIHSSQYKNPDQLPAGEVMVVGSGQSGAQLAEDLHLAGRRVHLCLGDAPRIARFYRGRDCVAWLEDMGTYKVTAAERATQDGVAARANHYVTGRDGGHELDLRQFAQEGMQLYGLMTDYANGHLQFKQDLREALEFADATSQRIKDSIDAYIAEQGIEAPVEERYTPVWEPSEEPTSLDLAASGITSIVWAIGYRADFRWIDLPAFNGAGRPVHERGVTPEEGLFFIGLPWQWTWGSARMSGVAADAAHLVQVIEDRLVAAQPERRAA